MTELTGITPDLVTLGKIVGGGLPAAAYLGPAALMEQLAPNGPVYQAGTLSGNPLAMAAGLATLAELERPGTYARLEALGAELERGLAALLARQRVRAALARVGSILWFALQPGPSPRAWHAVERAGAARDAALRRGALARGLMLAPSAFEVAFLSLAHEREHLARILAILDEALAAAEVPTQ
jgi:glutamate-1-semialdehyde 2,1-aminomutase